MCNWLMTKQRSISGRRYTETDGSVARGVSIPVAKAWEAALTTADDKLNSKEKLKYYDVTINELVQLFDSDEQVFNNWPFRDDALYEDAIFAAR